MRAFIDHIDGMEQISLGDVPATEITNVANALQSASVWIRDYQGEVMQFPFAGVRIEHDGCLVFLFGPDEA